MSKGILTGTEQHNLSTENIKAQKDISIVNILNGYFGEIVDTIESENVKPGRAMRNRTIRTAFARIDKAIHDRFGFNLRTIEDKHNTLAVQTTPAGMYNVLAGNVTDNYNSIDSYLKEMGTGDIDPETIDVTTTKWEQILKNYLQSIDAVERKLSSSSITVDLENAKIYGYPDKSFANILINPVLLVSKAGLSASQLTAAFLHEVGHVFTHLEYSYKTVSNTSMLIESILDEVGKNKTPLDAIKLSYYKVYGDDQLEHATTTVTAAVGVTSKYIDDLRNHGGSTFGGKDSERTADQFATRFGVGVELTEAVDKLTAIGDTALTDGVVDMGMLFLKLYIVSLLLLIFIPALGTVALAAVTGLLYGVVLGMAIGLVIYAVYSVINIIFSKGIDTENRYDSPKRRVLRIKNELVRQLRTMDLDKEATASILQAVTTLTTASEGLDDNNENVIARFVGSFFNYSSDQNEMRDLDNVVNDLMNNDLHVMASSLKTI